VRAATLPPGGTGSRNPSDLYVQFGGLLHMPRDNDIPVPRRTDPSASQTVTDP